MNRIARFYRRQLHLLWRWSGGGTSIAVRAALIFASSLAAFAFTAWLVPGIAVRDAAAAALTAFTLAALSTITRPVLIALLSGISVMLVGAGTLLVQAAAIVVIARLPTGIVIQGAPAALLGAVVYAVVHTALAAGLSIANDESFFGTLVRQLVARRTEDEPSDVPGVIFIQIDGLSYHVLRQQLERDRMPTLARWLRSGMRLDEWEPLLPTQTSASQAGILHGNNDGIPAFRWWEKEPAHLYVSNHPADAKEIMARVSDGQGLLVGGASIGNLMSGDARRSYLTAATLHDPARELRRSHVLDWFFVSPYAYVRWIVLSIGEIAKEVVQAARRSGGPRGARAFPYPLARAATNVVLRHLVAALVIEEMYRGTRVVYADFVDYDEIAHHAGIDGIEARQALTGLDRILAILEKATLDAPRPYRFVLLSDHGQSPGAMFRQREGERLEEIVDRLAGGQGVTTHGATRRAEHAGRITALVSEASGLGGRLARRAAHPRPRDEDRLPDVVVAASGNLAQVSFTGLAGRASRAAIDARHPGLVDALVREPWIGLVVVRDDGGAVAIGPTGSLRLADGRVTGDDPVAVYGAHALEGLRRVDAMSNCGDLVVVSRFDPDTGEVAAFEDQIGSHGGLGGWQSSAFVLHPAAWDLPEHVVGATGLHAALRSWLGA